MNDLNKALGDVSSIRRQMAQGTQFRGYGPRTLASTGVVALAAAGAQALWLPDPAKHIAGYLSIWIGTAAMSAALIGAQMYTRTRRIPAGALSVGHGYSIWGAGQGLVAGILLASAEDIRG